MTELVAELIVTVDGFAKGTNSPPYYGYDGPEFSRWLTETSDQPHRNLMGRKTYELLADLPKEFQDDSYVKMTNTPGWVFSSSLERVGWPGLNVVRSNLVDRVRDWKRDGGPEIRTAGSLSIVRQLISAGLVDRLRLMLCPLVLPSTGVEPAFADYPEIQFDLLDTRILDKRIVILDYRPSGPAPRA